MGDLSSDQVRHVVKLARLSPSDAEVESLREKLGAVLGYIERLHELDLADVRPMAHVGDETNRLDDDVVGAHLSNETLIKMAPKTDGAYVRVPKVLGDGGGA